MRHVKVGLVLAALVMSFPISSSAQDKRSTDDFVEVLRAPAAPFDVDVKDIQERALERIKKGPGQKPQDRTPLVGDLDKLPQLTLDIQFNSDSAIIRPESYKTLGQIADALYHPSLLDRKFLVVGHIEATGRRPNNLELSQRRAGAVREALVTTFRVSPQRVMALGLGEEQLLDRAKAGSPANRRMQIIVIGKR